MAKRVVKITTDTSDARKDLKGLANDAKKAANESGDAWSQAFTFGIASTVSDLAKDAGRSLLQYASDAAQARQDVVNLADETGLAAEQLEGMRLAALRGGADFDSIADATRDFGEALVDFQLGGGKAEEALNLLGVTADDVANRSLPDLFREVVNTYSAMEEGADKVFVGQQLMSDQGAELNRILGDGTLDDWVRIADRFGNDVGPEAAQATRDWQAATGELEIALQYAGTTFLQAFGQDSAAQFLRRFTLGFVAATAFVDSWMSNLDSKLGLSESMKVFNTLVDGGAPVAAAAGIAVMNSAFTATKTATDEGLSGLLGYEEAIRDAMAAAEDFTALQGMGTRPSGGRAAPGSLPDDDADKEQAKRLRERQRMIGELTKSIQDSTAAMAEPLQALQLEYEARLANIYELGIRTEEYGLAEQAAARLREEYIQREKDLRADLAKQKADEFTAEMDQIRQLKQAEEDRQRAMAIGGLDAASTLVGSFTTAYAQITKHNIQFAEDQERAKKRQAEQSKNLALFEVGVQGAIAMARAAVEGGPFLAPVLIAEMVGIFAGIVGVLNSQTYHTGMMDNRHGSPGSDQFPAMLQAGEAVVPRDLTRELGGPAGVGEALRGGRGGQQVTVVNIDFGDERVQQMIAGKVGRHVPTDTPLGWETRRG